MFTFMFNFFTRSLLVLLVAMLSVNYLPDKLFEDFPLKPNSFEPNNYETVKPEWNTQLSDGNPEYIQLNNILGPESIAISKEGLLYTGLADGRLVELDPTKNYKVRVVTRVKQSSRCPDNIATRASECGRFLQLRFVNETLYAIETNTGLYRIDHKKSSKSFVGPKQLNEINLYNSFAFDPKEPNMVYITISSTRRKLLDIVWSLFELDNSGQVIAYDTKTGKRAVVADGMMLTNGIDVDVKRDRLLVSETLRSRVSSISLQELRTKFKQTKDGDKLANVEVKPLLPLLPGNPDNIVIEGDIAYIALPFVKLNGKEFVDHLANMPEIRKAMARMIFGLGKVLEYIHENLFKHPLLEQTYRELKCGHVAYRVALSSISAVIEYNLETGASRLMGSGDFGFVSEAVRDNQGNLFIGSFRSPFIVKQKV